MSDSDFSSNEYYNDDLWCNNLDIQIDFNSHSRIINDESNNQDEYNKESLKSLISYFDLLYYNKYKTKVINTYHCNWNKYSMFLFCQFPNRKYQVNLLGNVHNGSP